MLATVAFLDVNRLADVEREDMLIPHNITKDHHRRIGGVEHVFLTEHDLEELANPAPSPEEILEIEETFSLRDEEWKMQLSMLDCLLDILTPLQKRIVKMHFLWGKEIHEIGHILALTPNHERFSLNDIELSLICSLEQMRIEAYEMFPSVIFN